MYATTHNMTPMQDYLAITAAFSPNRRMAAKTIPTSTPAPDVSHETLLGRVAEKKDRAAFVELFHYFAPRVKSYLLKHGASDAQAEEIVQNTFITVWEKAASYNPKKSAASTWIFTIARNKRIDALRREKFVEVNSENPVLENQAAPETPDDYADKDTVKQMAEALKSLPPEQAKLLRMAFFEDKSHQKIADETKLPLGTVKSRLRLALDKMRQLIKRDTP